jgi:hypothetical protein
MASAAYEEVNHELVLLDKDPYELKFDCNNKATLNFGNESATLLQYILISKDIPVQCHHTHGELGPKQCVCLNLEISPTVHVCHVLEIQYKMQQSDQIKSLYLNMSRFDETEQAIEDMYNSDISWIISKVIQVHGRVVWS